MFYNYNGSVLAGRVDKPLFASTFIISTLLGNDMLFLHVQLVLLPTGGQIKSVNAALIDTSQILQRNELEKEQCNDSIHLTQSQ